MQDAAFDNSGAELVDKPFGEQMVVCEQCGKPFVKRVQTQRVICDECYRGHRSIITNSYRHNDEGY